MSLPEARSSLVVVTTEIVLPSNTNTHGTMFGGDVLAMMDKTANRRAALLSPARRHRLNRTH